MRSLAGLGGGLRGMPPSCWGPWAMEGVQAFRCPFLPPCFAQCVCVSPPRLKSKEKYEAERASRGGGGGGNPSPPSVSPHHQGYTPLCMAAVQPHPQLLA